MQIRKEDEEGLGRGRKKYLACRGFTRLIHRALQNLGKERDCSHPRGPEESVQEGGIKWGSTKSWNPESGKQKPDSGIQWNPQDSAIRLHKNCLKVMSAQMLYFSIRDTRNKKSN